MDHGSITTGREKIESAHQETIDSIQNDHELEPLDYHIRDDHGDPHRAALEDIDADSVITKSTWAAVFFLGFTFQPSLSFTILLVFPILVQIALELQGTIDNVNWMASGWSIAGSVSFAIAGQLSDYFGRRYIILFGQVLLILGHIVGATSQSVNQAIAAMVILGFGTGTTFVLYPGISELLPNRRRSIGLAWTELNILPFSTFGPLIAKALLKNVTWRWVYYLGLITGIISFVGTAIFYNPPSKPLRETSRRQLLSELDYLGIFCYTAGLTLFLLGLGWGGISYPWKSAAVLTPLILGAFIFVLTFVWDLSGHPKRPIFPKRLFTRFREYTVLLVIIFVAGVVYTTLTDLIPQQIEYMFTSDSIKAGLYNIPAGFGGAAGGTFLGGLIPHIRHVHLQLLVGIGMQTVFTALCALITPNPDTIPMALVFQLLANIPYAWITLCCYITAGLHIPHRDLGLALGLIGTFRFLGGAVGSTVFSTILNNKAATGIATRVTAAVEPLGYPVADVPALVAALTAGTTSTLSHTSSQIIAAASSAMKYGYADAFRITWLSTLPFGVIACTLAVFVRDPSPYFTARTAVVQEKERFKDGYNAKKKGETMLSASP